MLDAMTPAFAAAAPQAAPGAPRRSPTCPTASRCPTGRRRAVGAGFEFSRVLKPLEPFRAGHAGALGPRRTTTAQALGDGPGDHARAAASYLTGVHPRKTAGADIQNGISVDQVAAQQIGSDDALPVARARVRRLADDRQLRFRLFVRLHQQPVVARPGHADAAGNESAPRLRAAVRRHRHERAAGRARAASAVSPQHPGSRQRADDAAVPRRSARPIAASSTNT